MIEPAEVQEVQPMSAVGKVLVTDDSTSLCSVFLIFSGIKLWNTVSGLPKRYGMPLARYPPTCTSVGDGRNIQIFMD